MIRPMDEPADGEIEDLGPEVDDELSMQLARTQLGDEVALIPGAQALATTLGEAREPTGRELAVPTGGVSTNVVEIAGGNFNKPSFDTNTYNLTRRDEKFAANFVNANRGEQTIQHVQSQYIIHYGNQADPEQGQSPERRGSGVDEDRVQLADKFFLIKSRPLCQFAQVYEGEEVSEITGIRRVAVKFLAPYDEKNIQEAKILLKLAHHRNVVSIIHADTYSGGPFPTMYIVMELCHTKNLGQYILEEKHLGRPVEFYPRQKLIKQIAEGLDFIHSNSIVHRDLKPDNILFSEDMISIKIADFGLSKELRRGHSVTAQSAQRVGTDGYRAPETYNLDVISKKADVFAFGLIVHFVLTNGKHPYGEDPDLWNYNIKNNLNCVVQELPEVKQSESVALIDACLEYRPEDRPNTQDILSQRFFYPAESLLQTEEQANLPEEEEEAGREAIVLFDIETKSVMAYTPSDQDCTRLNDMEDSLITQSFSTVMLSCFLYVLLENKFAYRLQYTNRTSKWKRVADMLLNHGPNAPVAAVKNYIYAAGNGFSRNRVMASNALELYDPMTDLWTRLADMNTRKDYHYITAINDYIYCCGGKFSETWTISASIEKYDCIRNKWEYIAPMLHGIVDEVIGFTSLEENLYILAHNDICRYDTRSQQWTFHRPSIPLPFDCSFNPVAVSESIYCLCSSYKDTFLYALQLNAWKLVETFEGRSFDVRAAVSIPLTGRRSQSSQRSRISSTASEKSSRSRAANSIALFDRTFASLRIYTPSVRAWTIIKGLPTDLVDRNFHAESLGDALYTLMDNRTVYKLLFNDQNPVWKRVANMLHDHGWMSPGIAMDGRLFVLGRGYSMYPSGPHGLCESYEPSTDKWTQITNMNHYREAHYVAATKGYIYCILGRNDKAEPCLEVDRYHAVTNSWERIAPMPRPIQFPPLRAVGVNSMIYAIGGTDMQQYDPVKNLWSIITPGSIFPFDLGVAFGAGIVDGEVHGIGQRRGRKEIRKLILKSMTWTLVEQMNDMDVIPRESAAIALHLD